MRKTVREIGGKYKREWSSKIRQKYELGGAIETDSSTESWLEALAVAGLGETEQKRKKRKELMDMDNSAVTARGGW